MLLVGSGIDDAAAAVVESDEVGLNLDAGALIVDFLVQPDPFGAELGVQRRALCFEVAHTAVVLRDLGALGCQVSGVLVGGVAAGRSEGCAFGAGVGGPEPHLREDEERGGGKAGEAATDGGRDVVFYDAVGDDPGCDEHHEAGREGSELGACGCVVHPYPRLSLGCCTPAVVGVALVLKSLLPLDRRPEHLARQGVGKAKGICRFVESD
ncbi:hypothetical protein [Streptomyces sp. A0592]|uniref:hypothetical protein n=1 Tax=Streptomyces sp. A0592 TaxID=2563099 RepID=UPI00109EE182|nr:hypothetical protein [Streptomyces sp. A0592]THA82777.1 hypothetical protein E6U81_19750 [Streptomyces sp. A0592]